MPVYNAAEVLTDQLDALAHQTYEGPWELIVADNGSTDDSPGVLQRHQGVSPRLRIVDASTRQGATHARNVGTDAAGGDLIVYCDADDVVDRGWLEAMVGASATAGIVGGRLDTSRLNRKTARRWRSSICESELPHMMDFLPFASSANLAVWRDVYDDLGGWDERYLCGCDDVDFSWRAQLSGHELRFAPHAVVHYRYRPTVRGNARQVYRYATAMPMLYRDFRAHGARRKSVLGALCTWARLFWTVPRLARRATRGRWVVSAARSWGHLVGSAHHRIWYP